MPKIVLSFRGRCKLKKAVEGEKDTCASVKKRFMAGIFMHFPQRVKSRKPLPALTLRWLIAGIKIRADLKEASKINYYREYKKISP
jgi:hypothetical protein